MAKQATNTQMDDKTIMANMLTSTKSLCDLMLHGSIESATPNVHNAFKLVLNDSLDMQNQIYSKMSEKGWYPAQNAEQKQINQTKKKYSTGA